MLEAKYIADSAKKSRSKRVEPANPPIFNMTDLEIVKVTLIAMRIPFEEKEVDWPQQLVNGQRCVTKRIINTTLKPKKGRPIAFNDTFFFNEDNELMSHKGLLTANLESMVWQ